jgi:HAMP domain-containing protein
MDLNDQTMYRTASELRNRAKKSVMPAIVAMISALIFALIFNFFLNLYIVKPIRQMIDSTRGFISGRPYHEVKTNTRDEISELSANIQDLVNTKHHNS